MADWLRNLSIVLATAVAGFLLGPYLANRWQDHKEQLSTRSTIVEKIGTAVGRFDGTVQSTAYSKRSQRAALDKAFVAWQVDSEAIYTQIAAYINSAKAREWSNFAYDMTWVYYVFKRGGAVKPRFALQKVCDYLHRPCNTVNGILENPFKVSDPGVVNPTYDGALLELMLQLRLKERAIIDDVVGSG